MRALLLCTVLVGAACQKNETVVEMEPQLPTSASSIEAALKQSRHLPVSEPGAEKGPPMAAVVTSMESPTMEGEVNGRSFSGRFIVNRMLVGIWPKGFRLSYEVAHGERAIGEGEKLILIPARDKRAHVFSALKILAHTDENLGRVQRAIEKP